MSKINHTKIPTAGLFGGRGYAWNPIKGCNNKGCFLHPVNNGKCWAASICNRMAGSFAESEAKYLTTKEIGKYDSLSFPQRNGWRGKKKTHEDRLEAKLKKFEPTWLEFQFQKEFPKKRSCILIGYMCDIAFIPRGWVQKMIDRIECDNIDRNARDLPLHVFQFLTKDPNVYKNFKWPLNCWMGFTATKQTEFNKRYHDILLLSVNQKKPFSPSINPVIYAYLEPLLGNIDISMSPSIDWVIIGGGQDPVNPDWVRSIRDQCQEAGIPFYFKQWGVCLPDSQVTLDMFDRFYFSNKILRSGCWKIGKKHSGNTLDRETWEQFPEVKNA